MRALLRITAVTTAAGLLIAPAAGMASASASHPASASHRASAASASKVHLRGGTTSVTTAPGIAAALLGGGIIPIATWPGRESLLSPKSGPAVTFSFPVTGGRVSLSPLGGQIRHHGGILFLNAANGKSVKVSRFVISLTHKDLTGIVNGNPKARVPLFRLSLSHARLKAGRHTVRASRIGVRLTKTAAGALDGALGTSLFKPGMRLGTAATLLRF